MRATRSRACWLPAGDDDVVGARGHALSREIFDDELAQARQALGRRVAERVGPFLAKHVLEAMTQKLVRDEIRATAACA